MLQTSQTIIYTSHYCKITVLLDSQLGLASEFVNKEASVLFDHQILQYFITASQYNWFPLESRMLCFIQIIVLRRGPRASSDYQGVSDIKSLIAPLGET